MVDAKKKKPARKAASKKSGTAAPRKKATTARPKAGPRKATTTRSKASGKKSTAARPKASRKAASKARPEPSLGLEQQFGSLFEGISDLASSAFKLADKTRGRASRAKEQVSVKRGTDTRKTPSPTQLRQMADAGESLRDLREVAGLTLADIAAALNLKDKSVLQAVEDGREALSLEMIMRLASLYARNDPIPFVVKYVRTYRPKLWEVLEGWGLDGLPTKIERERRFMNIYKRRDAARQLSSEGFEKVLAFTQEAFELALHFIAEMEEIENEVNHKFDDINNKEEEDTGYTEDPG